MKKTHLIFAVWMLMFFGSGCGSDGDENTDSSNEQNVDLSAASNEDSDNTAVAGDSGLCGVEPELDQYDAPIYVADSNCGFDPELKGKAEGSQVDNFIMEEWFVNESTQEAESKLSHFHWNCGCESKAVWVFLSTGWCSNCENYATTAQNFYDEYKDRGLRIVWVIGEANERDQPPSDSYMAEYVTRKGVNFTIVKDTEFRWVKRYIDPSVAGNILPRQYVLDGDNMEMVFAGGQPFARGECEMKRLLGETNEVCENIAEAP